MSAARHPRETKCSLTGLFTPANQQPFSGAARKSLAIGLGGSRFNRGFALLLMFSRIFLKLGTHSGQVDIPWHGRVKEWISAPPLADDGVPQLQPQLAAHTASPYALRFDPWHIHDDVVGAPPENIKNEFAHSPKSQSNTPAPGLTITSFRAFLKDPVYFLRRLPHIAKGSI